MPGGRHTGGVVGVQLRPGCWRRRRTAGYPRSRLALTAGLGDLVCADVARRGVPVQADAVGRRPRRRRSWGDSDGCRGSGVLVSSRQRLYLGYSLEVGRRRLPTPLRCPGVVRLIDSGMGKRAYKHYGVKRKSAQKNISDLLQTGCFLNYKDDHR